MTRAVLLLLLVLLATVRLTAQWVDTTHERSWHQPQVRQLVVPSLLLAGGITISAVPTLHDNIDGKLREELMECSPKHFYLDEGLQYVPLAMPMVLKAAGLESRHGYRDLLNLTAATAALGFVEINVMKNCAHVQRPNGIGNRSFPSGHTFTAFAGAEMLRREYGDRYPAVAVAGYGVATAVGALRIYNDRHWCCDVLAGAAIGILTTSLSYWIAPYLQF